jgi:hypothetical protein
VNTLAVRAHRLCPCTPRRIVGSAMQPSVQRHVRPASPKVRRELKPTAAEIVGLTGRRCRAAVSTFVWFSQGDGRRSAAGLDGLTGAMSAFARAGTQTSPCLRVGAAGHTERVWIVGLEASAGGIERGPAVTPMAAAAAKADQLDADVADTRTSLAVAAGLGARSIEANAFGMSCGDQQAGDQGKQG